MDILVIGGTANLEEVREKFGDGHQYRLLSNRKGVLSMDNLNGVVFDFLVDQGLSDLGIYYPTRSLKVFVDVSFMSLSRLSAAGLSSHAFGFCGLPTFLNREILEASLLPGHPREALDAVSEELGTKCEVVADQVGLVTPRVICMIINEAYRTMEEGIANRSDIDVAMRLGTNYPYGPFEWAERIGLSNVARVLSAVRLDTQDERYQISRPLARDAGVD